jgi:hypothetical protein
VQQRKPSNFGDHFCFHPPSQSSAAHHQKVNDEHLRAPNLECTALLHRITRLENAGRRTTAAHKNPSDAAVVTKPVFQLPQQSAEHILECGDVRTSKIRFVPDIDARARRSGVKEGEGMGTFHLAT